MREEGRLAVLEVLNIWVCSEECYKVVRLVLARYRSVVPGGEARGGCGFILELT